MIAEYEPYGMVGLGDVRALLEIQRHLHLLQIMDVTVTAAQDVGQNYGRNLVLVGGPDANSATALAMKSQEIPVKFDEGTAGRTELQLFLEGGHTFRPELSPSGTLTSDVGFVAQVASPYDDEATAVLLVGVYGAATFAAARLVTSGAGVRALTSVPGRRCIAVFTTNVAPTGEISRPNIRLCRPLPPTS